MEDHSENIERLVVRAIHSKLSKWFAAAFVLGATLVVAGEIVTSNSGSSGGRAVAGWTSVFGVWLSAASGVLMLVSWFKRETTKHSGFRREHLPTRYSVVAWSAVAAAVLAFGIIVWYSLSRGLTSW